MNESHKRIGFGHLIYSRSLRRVLDQNEVQWSRNDLPDSYSFIATIGDAETPFGVEISG